MKKIILPLALFITTLSFSQNVAINTTGAAGNTAAGLDINIPNTGLLIPNVALSSTTVWAPISGGATGSLMVYNTATAGVVPNNVTPGYYYWNPTTTRWVRLISGTNDYWITGASVGTVNNLTATGFLGTTSNNHVDFVTNGIVRGRMSNLGEFFVGTTNTALPGDLMNGVGNATFPWAVNGYTNQNAGAVYGQRQVGSTGLWGAVQGETSAGITAGSSGVSGLASSNNHRGVNGDKPNGGTGWGGLFTNDLGYTGFFGVASDERLKINIKPIGDGMNTINKIKVYSYNMDTVNYQTLGDGSLHYGVMAQELKTVVPSLVKIKNIAPVQSRSGETLVGPTYDINMVNYVELIPIMIKAMQEQQLIIDEQQKALEDLLLKIQLLERK